MIPSLSSFASVLGLVTLTAAQSSSTVVCVAGQCVQGFSNTTIGASLSASGSSTSLHLLPGQYTSTTNPQLLHDLLVSSSASLSTSAGFTGGPSISSLPLNLALQPGLAIYSESLYAGQDAFTSLPTTPAINVTLPMAVKSLSLSENVWVAVSSSGSGARTVLWDSVPDLSQISLASSLSLLDIQSTTCSPSCAGAGVCSSSGQCVCPSNFAGSSCETCAPGFFGPQCQPCPDGCDKCDDGVSGSGRCISPEIGPTDPRKCNCVNGVCGTDGSCACNDGWIDKTDGTKCSACAAGFFLTSTGDCSSCPLGCSSCSDTTGACTACRPGYTQNINDRTKCDPIKGFITGGIFCPDNTFSLGTECQQCSTSCLECNGPGEGDCLTCKQGLFMAEGKCVQAGTNGICSGSGGLVADNNKKICETCPSKCTSCGIPDFTAGSTINLRQCNECLPGFFLSEGNCVAECPAGKFVDPQDNLSCISCSRSCGTCAGSADFCLTCPENLLASNGKCVSTCPSDTFTSSSDSTPPTNACLTCHPDCLTCTGPNFNQCSSCPPSRPVLSAASGASAGRCLPTCSKSQYFDATTQTCQSCDGNCSSCTGAGPSNCLSCQSSRQVVRAGKCVDASCTGGAGVIAGLGVCLSELVQVPTATTGPSPLPTISGLADPTAVSGRAKLQWWQILLMALGCAFIFIAILWCCRRRAKKQRAKKTIMFAKGKGIDRGSWKWNGFVAGWRMLFGRNGDDKTKTTKGKGSPLDLGEGELPIAYNHHEVTSRPVSIGRGEDIKMATLKTGDSGSSRDARVKLDRRNSKKSKQRDELESYIDAYDYSRRSMSIHSRTPSELPDLDGFYPPRNRNHDYDRDRLRREVTRGATANRHRDLERESMFSEMTGMARHTPEPRIPIKRSAAPIGYSDSGRSSRSSSRSSRSDSPARNAGKLKKAQRTVSDEAMNSVVIQPQPREAVLIDLGEGGGGGSANKQLPQPPLQYQSPPFLSSQAVQMPTTNIELTAAQTYAMNVRPELVGGGVSSSTATAMLPSGVGLGITNPSAIGSGGGLYWLQPTEQGSSTNFVLKPAVTGSSMMTTQTQVSSKNPFRQPSY